MRCLLVLFSLVSISTCSDVTGQTLPAVQSTEPPPPVINFDKRDFHSLAGTSIPHFVEFKRDFDFDDSISRAGRFSLGASNEPMRMTPYGPRKDNVRAGLKYNFNDKAAVQFTGHSFVFTFHF